MLGAGRFDISIKPLKIMSVAICLFHSSLSLSIYIYIHTWISVYRSGEVFNVAMQALLQDLSPSGVHCIPLHNPFLVFG